MQNVIYNRQHIGNLPPTVEPVNGYIAVLDCGAIGQIWYIQHAGVEEQFLVTDCAGDWATRNWMRYNHVLGEVDFETAMRWGTVGRAASIAVCEHRHRSEKPPPMN